MTHSQPKVSVIVPVYNAAPYIERCARSLFSQTLDSIEFIFVDDKTPDDSIDIVHRVLMEYPERKAQVKFIELQVNSKQAAARSAGLAVAKGDYIIHCDPDDWVDLDFYRQLYECAVNGGYDLVTADVVYHFPDNKLKHDTIADFDKPMEVLEADSFFSLSLWNQLLKAELIHQYSLDFYSGVNYMEDFGFNARAYFFVKSVGHVHNVFYHYNKANDDSITQRMNDDNIVAQRIECLKNLNEFFSNKGVDIHKLGLLQHSKRDIKDLLLKKNTLKEWQQLFPEVSDWVVRQKDASLPYRMVYWLSHHIGVWPMRIFLSLKDKST